MGHSDGRSKNVNIDSMSHRESPEWKKAETFRKAEIFGRAAKAFKEVWDQTGDPQAGWRYAHCLRRSGYHDLAINVLTELNEFYPDDQDIREEFVWSIYEGRLLSAKNQADNRGIIDAAREMVAAGAEGRSLKLAVFSVVSAAKTKGHWNLISAWCDLLDPQDLDTTTRGAGKGTIPSDRERWYFAKLKALVCSEEWHTARELAEVARNEFPSNQSFLRWHANSLAGVGHLVEAVDLLETLRPRIPWYALHDISKYCLEIEEDERAWPVAQEGARCPGPDSAKVNLWELMARLSLALGMGDCALSHVGLMEAVRRDENWPLRPSHQELINTVVLNCDLKSLPSRETKEWKRLCRGHWGGQSVEIEKLQKPDPGSRPKTGKIVGWDVERTFAFIQPSQGGEQVFFLAKDAPQNALSNGTKVNYRTIKHFDKRKNRESLRAVDIVPERQGAVLSDRE